MAYATRWETHRVEACRLEAENRAGPAPLGFLYRFDRQSYSYTIDADMDVYGSYSVVELTAYPIHKLTPCGWTLEVYSGARRKWVSRETTKRFALPTIEEALESFVARQERRIQIMKLRIAESERAIDMVRAQEPL